MFCQKYGNHCTNITVDLAEDAPNLIIFGEDNEVSAEATNEKSEDYKKIHKVSRIQTCYDRSLPVVPEICSAIHCKWDSESNGTHDNTNPFTSLISQNSLKQPCKLMMYHFYMKKNYQMHIKAVYEDRFVTALRE